MKNKTITLVGALCATFLAFACDDGTEGIPPIPVPSSGGSGSGGAGNPGSGGNDTTTGSGGDATTEVTTETTTEGTGGAAADGEALLDMANPSWVDGMANTKGIQGAFFVLEDSMKEGLPVVEDPPLVHTNLTPDDFADATSLCVTGTIAAVTTVDGMDCDAADAEDLPTGCQWSAIWGGGIGLNLNETGETPADEETGEPIKSVQSPWDAVASGATGFAFNISGTFDGTMRFKGKMQDSDDDFCTEVEFGDNKIDMTAWAYSCWDESLATEKSIDLTKMWQIQWQLVTKQNTEYTGVEFCLNSLSVY